MNVSFRGIVKYEGLGGFIIRAYRSITTNSVKYPKDEKLIFVVVCYRHFIKIYGMKKGEVS